MGYGIGDLIADVATGGMYSATKATVEVATGATKEVVTAVGEAASGVAGAAGTAKSVAGGATSVVAGKELKFCCYTMEGDYLLNMETGDLWVVDKDKKQLIPIERQKSALANVATAMSYEAMKALVQKEKYSELPKMEYAAREIFSKRLDSMMTILDKEIDKHLKSATRG